MTADRHGLPRGRDVLREQVAAVGLALRGPGLVGAGLLLAGTVALGTSVVSSGETLDFRPEHQMLPAMLGLLFPMGVWKGEERFGASVLWTLPVDRRHHALAKVFAGWTWLMAAVALFGLWQLAFAMFTGGGILADETIRVLQPGAALGGSLEPGTFRSVRWSPQPVFWLVPFTAATGTYLLTSALALAVRHPARWVAGTILTVALVAAVVENVNAERFADLSERVLRALFEGRYGLDALLTARTETLKVVATTDHAHGVVVWRGLPDPGEWAVATLLWIAAGLAALWAATSRHRERRSG